MYKNHEKFAKFRHTSGKYGEQSSQSPTEEMRRGDERTARKTASHFELLFQNHFRARFTPDGAFLATLCNGASKSVEKTTNLIQNSQHLQDLQQIFAKSLTKIYEMPEFGAVHLAGPRGGFSRFFPSRTKKVHKNAALAANAAAFGRSSRWVFQSFPTSEKNVQRSANLVDLENDSKIIQKCYKI